MSGPEQKSPRNTGAGFDPRGELLWTLEEIDAIVDAEEETVDFVTQFLVAWNNRQEEPSAPPLEDPPRRLTTFDIWSGETDDIWSNDRPGLRRRKRRPSAAETAL